jgi:hypothetical protein
MRIEGCAYGRTLCTGRVPQCGHRLHGHGSGLRGSGGRRLRRHHSGCGSVAGKDRHRPGQLAFRRSRVFALHDVPQLAANRRIPLKLSTDPWASLNAAPNYGCATRRRIRQWLSSTSATRDATPAPLTKQAGCVITNGVLPCMSSSAGTHLWVLGLLGSLQSVGPVLMNDEPAVTGRPQTSHIP